MFRLIFMLAIYADDAMLIFFSNFSRHSLLDYLELSTPSNKLIYA